MEAERHITTPSFLPLSQAQLHFRHPCDHHHPCGSGEWVWGVYSLYQTISSLPFSSATGLPFAVSSFFLFPFSVSTQHFLHFLIYDFPEVLPKWLLNSAVFSSGCVRISYNCLCPAQGSLCHLFAVADKTLPWAPSA